MAVKFNPSSIGSGLGYATQINQLFSDVQSALQDALSRTGNGPNAMSADLDLGGNDLLNIGTANIDSLKVDGRKLASLSEMQDLTAEAQNWANLSYNTLVPEGDGVDDYSAKHFATVSSNWADKSNKWAETAEDAEVETGEYSALHWSKKSEGHAYTSLSHANDSRTYRDKAQEWAENPEDDEVETGQYSAFHWAQKAQQSNSNIPTVGTGDNNKIVAVNTAEDGYELKTAGEVAAYLRATTAEAESGTSNTTVMTPLRTQEWYEYKIQNVLFPVGSVVMRQTDPGLSESNGGLGFGTWQQIQGKVLVGVGSHTDGSGFSRTFSEGDEGGEYEHQLSVNEIPSHTHSAEIDQDGSTGSFGNWLGGNSGNETTYDTDATGGDASHNNIQPYFAVYMWYRTA